MEILGIGMSELIFIVIIALIVLGPKDMQKAGRTIGKFLRSIVTSDGWKVFQQTSRELRTLPHKLMREANEELNQIGNQAGNQIGSASNLTVNRTFTPDIPPRSQPFPAASTPSNLTDNADTPSTPEHTGPGGQRQEKENESGHQKDA